MLFLNTSNTANKHKYFKSCLDRVLARTGNFIFFSEINNNHVLCRYLSYKGFSASR